jgi:hypothetical protein
MGPVSLPYGVGVPTHRHALPLLGPMGPWGQIGANDEFHHLLQGQGEPVQAASAYCISINITSGMASPGPSLLPAHS